MYVPDCSTYRLQLHAGFPFDAPRGRRAAISRALGVGACYTSPYFAADAGQHARLRRLQSQRDQPRARRRRRRTRAFTARLARARPAATSSTSCRTTWASAPARNAWWRDVLENGPSSPAARFFDIDWTPVKAALQAKLLLPILGDQYGRVLERGELQLAFVDGAARAQVLRPRAADQPDVRRRASYSARRRAADRARSAPTARTLHEFLSILTSLQNLPPLHARRDPERDGRAAAREGSGARPAGAARRRSPGRAATQIDAARHAVQRRAGQSRQLRRAARAARGAGLPAVVLAHGVARDQLPALLRRQHAGRAARRGSGGLRRDARAARRAARGRHACRPCASIIPTACSIRRATSRCCRSSPRAWASSAAATADRPLYVVAEKILSRRRAAAGALGGRTARPATTTSTISTASSSTAAQARRMRRAYAKLTGQHRSVRRRALREQAADHGRRRWRAS